MTWPWQSFHLPLQHHGIFLYGTLSAVQCVKFWICGLCGNQDESLAIVPPPAEPIFFTAAINCTCSNAYLDFFGIIRFY